MMAAKPVVKFDDHDGKPVVAARIKIKTPGGALDSTMDVSPASWRTGDEIYMVAKCRVGAVAFPEHTKGDPSEFDRQHDVMLQVVTFVDAEIVEDAIDRQQKLIDDAAGVQRLNFDGDMSDDEWREQAGLSNVEDDTE